MAALLDIKVVKKVTITCALEESIQVDTMQHLRMCQRTMW